MSPGCAHCYAEAGSKRNPHILGEWGPQGTRVVAAESTWAEPLKWDKAAAEAGERRRVFCASLADVFEQWDGPMASHNSGYLHRTTDGWCVLPEVDESRAVRIGEVRTRLFHLIAETPHLDWLLLTKRPEAAQTNFPFQCGLVVGERDRLGKPTGHLLSDGPYFPNVWLGVSVEDQQRADERIPVLLETPAAVRFLSCEPLLGELDVTRYLPLTAIACQSGGKTYGLQLPGVGWVIIGGESGPNARPCEVGAIRSLVRQCRDAGVPCFVKQLGSNPRWSPRHGPCGFWPDHVRFDYERRGEESSHRIRLSDPKGGDMEEWSEDLRVREFPITRQELTDGTG